MTVRLNAEKLFKRGAIRFGNYDFMLMKTTCCEQYIVCEYEVGHIYYDPENLQNVVLEFDINACPICNSDKWDYTDVDEDEIPLNWTWAKYTNEDN